MAICYISFSDGKVAAAGLLADFFNVYMRMKNKQRTSTDKKILTSENIEEYLGKGGYLVFDRTDIENTGGNNGNMNKFDLATRLPIRPEELKVCVLRDRKGNIQYFQDEYIPEYMELEDFKEKYETEINADIIKYLQTHYKDSQEEIN